MRRHSVDRRFGLRCIGKIDAAQLDPGRRCRQLGRGVVQPGDARTPCERGCCDYLPERPRGAGHDNNFSVHD
jgi:hypothetical protein